MNKLKYKGYEGSVEVCLEDDLLHGRILGIRDLIAYEGQTVHEIRLAFQVAVNDYINHCEERLIREEPK